jgi:hypothetical protein
MQPLEWFSYQSFAFADTASRHMDTCASCGRFEMPRAHSARPSEWALFRR